MCDREKELQKLEEKLERENCIIREELEKKRKERRIEERIQQLQQEKEDMQYEIEHGISPEEKRKQMEETQRFINPKKIWL